MFGRLGALFKLRALEKQAFAEVQMGSDVKPGWQTTEFWLTVAMQVPMVAGVFLGQTNPITIGIGAACAIFYNILRSNHKTEMGKASIVAALQAAKLASDQAPQPTSAAAPSGQ